MMKFKSQHRGKWVAAKNDKIIDSAKSLTKLVEQVSKKENPDNLKFSLVPKGFIAG